jgi:hypothetical protein
MENIYRYGGRFLPGFSPMVRPLVPGERNRAAFDAFSTPLGDTLIAAYPAHSGPR